MKKYFTTGLAILLPLVLTFMIMNFLINFLTQPFLGMTQSLLLESSLFHHSFLFFSQTTFLNFVSKALILIFLMGFVLLIGMVGKVFLIDSLFKLGGYFFQKLPIVNKIYKATQDVVHSVFSSTSKSFSQVVLVPFPSQDNLVIGLVTGENVEVKHIEQDVESFVSVFIPGTPNPSVGFMLLYAKDQLTFTDMRVDEAMKLVVSCGIVLPKFQITPKLIPDDADKTS